MPWHSLARDPSAFPALQAQSGVRTRPKHLKELRCKAVFGAFGSAGDGFPAVFLFATLRTFPEKSVPPMKLNLK